MKLKNVRLHNNDSFLFCLLDVCGQFLSSVVVKISLLNSVLSNGRGSLDYARNVAKNFDEPKPDYPLSNSKHISSCRFEFRSNFHHADSKQSSHDREGTRQTPCSCSFFFVLRGPSCFSTQSRNSQPDIHQFFFSFWPRHYSINNIKTKTQLNIQEY